MNSQVLERGSTIAMKNKDFYGNYLDEGHVRAWSKDKYHLVKNAQKENINNANVPPTAQRNLSKKDFMDEYVKQTERIRSQRMQKHEPEHLYAVELDQYYKGIQEFVEGTAQSDNQPEHDTDRIQGTLPARDSVGATQSLLESLVTSGKTSKQEQKNRILESTDAIDEEQDEIERD